MCLVQCLKTAAPIRRIISSPSISQVRRTTRFNAFEQLIYFRLWFIRVKVPSLQATPFTSNIPAPKHMLILYKFKFQTNYQCNLQAEGDYQP